MTTRNHTDHTDGPTAEPEPTRPARLLAVISVPAAIASFLYVATGRGFMWDPWAYTAAWLTLIASLAYGLPMLDVTIDTVARAWRRTQRIARRTRHALAGVRRHGTSAAARRVRVVRGTANAKP